MKKALVLAGGGTKGIYECGVLQALRELGKDDWDLVIGVSVGALNAAMLVQNDFELLAEMYENLKAEDIVNGFVPDDMSVHTLISERAQVLPQLKYYLKEKGIDVRPFYEFVDRYYNPERFFASGTDFGCIAAREKDHSCVYVTKEMMKENGKDWLIASASAYPAFPVKEIDGEKYVDGGYYDNFPLSEAVRQGCDEIIGIELSLESRHPGLLSREHITVIRPHEDLENFLSFDRELMNHRRIIGYNDAMKKFGRYTGEKYTFEPFALPHFFDRWYLDTILLEAKIKNATNVTERIYSDELITDRLKTQLHVPVLTTRQYFYGMMDQLMTEAGASTDKVYTVKEAYDLIRETFINSLNEDFELYPSHVTEFASYMRNLDRKTIIAMLVHVKEYPEHSKISENIILAVYPMEASLAMFAYGLLKEEIK